MLNGAQVVLDLDETLVCAYSRSKVPADLLYSNATSFEVSYVLGNGRMSDVVVFPRPGVQAFLESLATFAELIVFTAGHAGACESTACQMPLAVQPYTFTGVIESAS